MRCWTFGQSDQRIPGSMISFGETMERRDDQDSLRVKDHSYLQAFAGHKVNQVANPTRVPPLIVIPRKDFYAVAANHQGYGSIHDGRARIAPEVSRDQFALFEAQI